MIHALVAAALQAVAQTAAPAPADDEETIVVTAPSQEQMRRNVADLSVETGAQQLSRWRRAVCPGVVGMTGEQAQFVLDRIAEVAFSVGLEVGAAGCRANVWIVYTSDANAVAQHVADEPGAMSSTRDYRDTRGRAAARDFINTPRPVRWWHVSQTVNTGDSEPGGLSLGISSEQPGGFSGFGPDNMAVYEASRLQATTRQVFDRAVIVVDARRMDGVTVSSLADYLAMVALAQLNPDADLQSAASIMNLFSPSDPVTQLTDWDRAYLEGLYRMRSNAINRGRQEREIARRMRTSLAEDSPGH